MEYIMWYLGVCSVLFCVTIYTIKVKFDAVTVEDLLSVIVLSYIPIVHLGTLWWVLKCSGILNKKVF